MRWDCLSFDALAGREVHDLLALRQRVFMLEQTCLFAEIDGHDPEARHLLGREDDALLVCARLLPAGVKMAARSIGRIAVAPQARGRGLGRAVTAEAIRRYLAEDPTAPIDLSAQAHLVERLYAPFGFRPLGAPYDEDGIPHLDLRFDPAARRR